MRIQIQFNRLIHLFLIGFLAFSLVSACAKTDDTTMTNLQQPAEDCRIVQHTMGQTCIPLKPQRIVALDLEILGNLLAMNIEPIATASYIEVTEKPFPKYFPDRSEDIKHVGSPDTPSLEKILQAKPDLIVMNDYLEGFYDQVSQISPTIVMQTESPWKQKLVALGKILNKEDIANQLINNYIQRIDELKQALGDRRTELIVSIATMTQSFGIWSYGSKHPLSIVLNDLDVQRPPSQVGDFVYTGLISIEKLDAIDGDVLFFLTRHKEEDNKAIAKLQENPLWKQLKVVQSDRVYEVDMDHWYLDNSILGINEVIDDLERYLVIP
ncbi:iron-siderophore ABC transporter substrate-binding protein [Pleurocapsa sp. CCALA 161]|uniref:ABC transporter substrate-binding protein n=1 Tax=Pleurocapsa sp. CCALA 161 TaxID=2107688 RepID=UPI000D04F82D|nr:iron-siderophore ABC transporter substrate-binding protein [Pleurocapsa sp. CCALA 161]PSB06393.1 iron-siderophore ABC transporter substrate-binding protein [Pleurocapsa sp. CCALA 161]